MSPRSVTEQKIGLTSTLLNFSRPSVNGRKIFGEWLPYGKIWRLGANESTKIQFDQDVTIGNQQVPAGQYALYAIPEQEKWTWIFNSDTTLWGDRGYDPSKDVLRHQTQVQQLQERVETFDLRWANLRPDKADLVLEWEYTQVKLPFYFPTQRQVEENIQKTITSGKASADDYYKAARYYLDNGYDLKKAKEWMEKRVELGGEQFGILGYKALLEYALGERDAAQQTMIRSLQLAREAGNSHYIHINELSLKKWAQEALNISAQEVVEKSIRYHDPQNTWQTGLFQISLQEERPGSSDRITQLKFDNRQSSFTLSQWRGEDHFFRHIDEKGCDNKWNGKTDFTEEERKQLRLDCSHTTSVRNYYLYLLGLPMKLKDQGTQIDPQAWLKDFYGKQLIEVKVTYSPEVGKDVWYFYFHPDTYALSGYRFYHDEQKNDGEYILLHDEATVGSLKLPKRREWYTHQDRLYLGKDEVTEMINH